MPQWMIDLYRAFVICGCREEDLRIVIWSHHWNPQVFTLLEVIKFIRPTTRGKNPEPQVYTLPQFFELLHSATIDV